MLAGSRDLTLTPPSRDQENCNLSSTCPAASTWCNTATESRSGHRRSSACPPRSCEPYRAHPFNPLFHIVDGEERRDESPGPPAAPNSRSCNAASHGGEIFRGAVQDEHSPDNDTPETQHLRRSSTLRRERVGPPVLAPIAASVDALRMEVQASPAPLCDATPNVAENAPAPSGTPLIAL